MDDTMSKGCTFAELQEKIGQHKVNTFKKDTIKHLSLDVPPWKMIENIENIKAVEKQLQLSVAPNLWNKYLSVKQSHKGFDTCYDISEQEIFQLDMLVTWQQVKHNAKQYFKNTDWLDGILAADLLCCRLLSYILLLHIDKNIVEEKIVYEKLKQYVESKEMGTFVISRLVKEK